MFSRNYSKICQNFLQNVLITRYVRTIHETYYEVLGVTRTCSTKEIKDAFIKLSKIHHPDKADGKGSQARFVQVLEAYNVLSKPDSRYLYDYELDQTDSPNRSNREFHQQTTSHSNRSSGSGYEDATFWTNRAKTDYTEKPYYGIKGINRVSNGTIAFGCIILATVGTIIQLFAIRYSLTLNRDELTKRSETNKLLLEEIEKEAKKNGSDLQIKLIESRLSKNFYSGIDRK